MKIYQFIFFVSITINISASLNIDVKKILDLQYRGSRLVLTLKELDIQILSTTEYRNFNILSDKRAKILKDNEQLMIDIENNLDDINKKISSSSDTEYDIYYSKLADLHIQLCWERNHYFQFGSEVKVRQLYHRSDPVWKNNEKQKNKPIMKDE